MLRAENLTTFMGWLSSNLGASTSWNHQGLFRSVMGLLYQQKNAVWFTFLFICKETASPNLSCWRAVHSCSCGRQSTITLHQCWSVALIPTLTCPFVPLTLRYSELNITDVPQCRAKAVCLCARLISDYVHRKVLHARQTNWVTRLLRSKPRILKTF